MQSNCFMILNESTGLKQNAASEMVQVIKLECYAFDGLHAIQCQGNEFDAR